MPEILDFIYGNPVLVVLAGLAVLLILGIYGAETFRGMKASRRFKRVVGDSIDLEVERISAFDNMGDDNIEGFLQRILPSVQSTQRRMSRAGIRLSVRLYLLAIAFVSITAGFFVSIPSVPPAIAPVGNPIIIAFCLHLANELVVLRLLRARYSSRLLKQLPEALDHIIRSLVVGQSLESAIRASVPAMQYPLADEMGMLTRLLDAGLTMEDALAVVSSEIDLPEFEFFAAAASAQMESGGDLAKVLEGLVDMIRGREQLQQKVASLSAEGKLSAWVLCLLPVFFIVGMTFWRPEFVAPLYETELGTTFLWAIAIAVLAGGILSWRMTQIKV